MSNESRYQSFSEGRIIVMAPRGRIHRLATNYSDKLPKSLIRLLVRGHGFDNRIGTVDTYRLDDGTITANPS